MTTTTTTTMHYDASRAFACTLFSREGCLCSADTGGISMSTGHELNCVCTRAFCVIGFVFFLCDADAFFTASLQHYSSCPLPQLSPQATSSSPRTTMAKGLSLYRICRMFSGAVVGTWRRCFTKLRDQVMRP